MEPLGERRRMFGGEQQQASFEYQYPQYNNGEQHQEPTSMFCKNDCISGLYLSKQFRF